MQKLLFSMILSGFFSLGQVTISTPRQGTGVPWRVCFTGSVSDPHSRVALILHSLENGIFYVEPEVSVRPDGTFRVMAYAAENSPSFNHTPLEAQAFVDPTKALHEGMRLSHWPKAASSSNIVDIYRQDGAPSGCGDGPESQVTSDRGMGAGAPLKTGGPVLPSSGALRPNFPTYESWVWLPMATVGFGVLFFFALMMQPERARQAMDLLFTWMKMFQGWFIGAVKAVGAAFMLLFRHQTGWLKKAFCIARNAVGCTGSMKSFALVGLTWPCLTILFWLAFIGDARCNLAALDLIFDADAVEASGIGPVPGVSAAPTATGIRASWAIAPVVSIWQRPLGPVAIGLAAMQGMFGIVLFWGLGKEVIRTKSRSLIRERFFATLCFVVLNMAIAALAGYRAYELSPVAVPWVVPTLIAACLGWVMPSIQAFAFHYLLDSLSDYLAFMGGGTATVGLFASASIVLAVGVVMMLLSMVALAAAFFGVVLFIAALEILFWLTLVMGQFVRDVFGMLRASHGPGLARRSLVHNSLVVLFTICALTLIAPTLKAAAAHDPTHSFDSWAVCIDTSLSVDPEQFAKTLRALTHILHTRVKANDLVWLILVKGDASTSALFEIPSVPHRRSSASIPLQPARGAEGILAAAIGALHQSAVFTDLADPLALGLNLLRTQNGGARKTLLIGSDFISDEGPGTISAHPPTSALHASAEGIAIEMLLACPTSKYLRRLQLTPAQIFEAVNTEWVKYFQHLGARSTSVRLVDAVPVDD